MTCCDVSEAGNEAPGSSHQLYPVPLLCSLHKRVKLLTGRKTPWQSGPAVHRCDAVACIAGGVPHTGAPHRALSRQRVRSCTA